MPRGGRRSGAGRPRANAGERYMTKTFTLSPSTVGKPLAHAKKVGRPASHIVEEAIEAYLSTRT